MTTIKSFSEKSRLISLYRSSLKSLIPLMTVIGITFFMIISLPFIYGWISGDIYYNYYNSSLERLGYIYNDTGIFADEAQEILVMIIAGIAALLLALVSNAYMHQKKNVDMYHSIPATRTELLTANAMASMTAIFIPMLLNYILSIGMQIIAFSGRALTYMPYHWFNFHSFFGIIIYALVVYFFVSFISVNVGTIFDSFTISVILGVSVVIVYLVSGGVWSDLSYGAYFYPGEAVMLLSPFSFMFYKYTFSYTYNGYYVGQMLVFLFCSLAAAAAFYFLAVMRYKKRGSELAEQTQTSGKFQTAVKMVACFGGTAFFYLVFNYSELPWQVIMGFIGAILFGVIVELVFSRGFKSMLKNLKWIAGTGAFCCLLIIVVSLDLTGYVKRVPAPQNVANVNISYRGRFDYLVENPWHYTDAQNDINITLPESIDIVTSAHRTTVNRWLENKSANTRSYYYAYGNLTLKYKLKSGFSMERRYGEIDSEAMSQLVNLEDKDDFIASRSPLFLMDNGKGANSSLVKSVYVSDSFETSETAVRISMQDTDRLLDALRSDMLNETLDGIMYPKSTAIGYLKLGYWLDEEHKRQNRDSGYRVSETIVVTPEYTNTIALLKTLGLYEAMDVQFQPDSVYIIKQSPSSDRWYKQIAVAAGATHYNTYVYDYWNVKRFEEEKYRESYIYENFIAATSSPSDVASIYSASSLQMVSEPINVTYPADGMAEYTVNDGTAYYAVFTKGGVVLGTKLVHYGDLPAHFKEAADKYTYDNYKNDDAYMDVVIPEEVVLTETRTK